MISIRSSFYILIVLIVLTACTEQPTLENDHLVHQTLYTAVAHPDRPAKDKQRDNIRKPAQVLEFLGVTPGMTVIEVMSTGGYYTELLSRVVGNNGKVYSHNNQMYYDFQSDKFVKQRLKNNRLPNVIRWDKELNKLDLADNSLDAVFLMLVFHDFYWYEESPEQIVADFYRMLKPGGTLAIVDHSAIDHSGIKAAQGMHGIHRIDEYHVKATMKKAGFILDGESDILRNSNDPRDKAFFDEDMKDIPTDRFILRYKKPNSAQTQPQPKAL